MQTEYSNRIWTHWDSMAMKPATAFEWFQVATLPLFVFALCWCAHVGWQLLALINSHPA